ncbi:MAG: sigma-70 family RNA polymerase sigma factor, partial [Verrucomicrobiota bacterium]
MTDDAQLLGQYVESRSEPAFAELVQRHLALVYHAAARQLGAEAHLAGDVAQGVFLLLADRARTLTGHPSLAGWLHATTRFKVAEILRTERRRRARETAAHLMHDVTNASAGASNPAEWERLRPVIDEVLLELNASDREAVLLRFFEQRPFAEIATRLRLTEATAHKRVERALEKLHERLGRRGVTSTAVALATLLGSHSAAAAPAGLAAAVTGAVVSSGLPVVATMGALSFMSMKTTAAVATIAVALVSGIATQQASARRDAAADLAAMESQNQQLTAKIRDETERQKRLREVAATPARAPAAVAATQRAPMAKGGLASVEESQAFLRDNPELRGALVAYWRATLAEEYAELIAELGLSGEKKERFLEIQAKGIRRIVGEHQLSLGGPEVTGAQIGAELREVLGEEGYQRYRQQRKRGAQDA